MTAENAATWNTMTVVAQNPDIAAAMVKLRETFPASETGQLPRGGTTLSYVGHAAITGRLLDVDPLWSWEPLAFTETGLPLFDVDGQGRPVGLWIRLTVCGVERLGYGSCPPGQFDAVKVLVGDALRNAAMRFGVALDLWVKGTPEESDTSDTTTPPPPEPPEPPVEYMSAGNVKAFIDKCGAAGCTAKDIDAIVMQATSGRTSNEHKVLVDEVTVLRAAFESWASERAEKVASSTKSQSATSSSEVGSTGKKVRKGVGPQTSAVENVKTDALL